MSPKYRYQFPIVIVLFRWGMTIAWQPPIFKIRPSRSSDATDSMLIYIGMFDEDD